ncbi:MAG: TetR/AcrR family transcriptional regulator [Gemmatimonadetes bacterium]|nr:TetR/AcrR family transcriptional regulator [Gemmatimonadota bacterium]
MAKKRTDRRIQRTQRRLKEALIGLIDTRDYDAISISEIVEAADVGRSTFYSHYTSKDDLLFSGFDRWILSLADHPPARVGGSPTRFRFSLPFLQHVATQKRFAQALIGRAGNAVIRQKTTALLAEVVRRELERMAPGKALSGDAKQRREAEVHGVVGAFLGVVTWWLGAGDRVIPEVVDRAFQELAGPA